MSDRAKVGRSPPRSSSSASLRTGPTGRTSIWPARLGPTKQARPTTRARPAMACGCSTNMWPTPSKINDRSVQVDFYQLAGIAPESVIATLSEKVLATGGRLLIVAEDEAFLGRLDRLLWDQGALSFLPHGLSGGADA